MEGGENEKEKKVYRLKAYAWLVQSEKMLRASCGFSGWDHFQVVQPGATSLPPDPLSWPMCCISIDQGTDGWCAANFLQYSMRCNVVVLKDPAHRTWNDVQLAMQDARLWPLALAMSTVVSCDHGPWSEHRFFTEAAEAAGTYCKLADPECPVFSHFYSHICKDLGMEADSQPEAAEEVFKSIPEAWSRKLPKVALSRWFQVFDAWKELDKVWHTRLVVLLYVCLSQGWIKTEAWNGWQNHQAAVAPEEKQPTGQEPEEIRKLRASCKNNLHFCCTMLLETEHQQVIRGLCRMAEPVRHAHGLQLHEMRSCAASLKHYIHQAAGGCFEPLHLMLQQLFSKDLWASLGLWMDGPLPAGACPTYPLALNENEVVGKVVTFSLCLIGRRLRECAWHTLGFPGSFALFLVPSQAQAALGRLKASWELYETTIKNKAGNFWRTYTKRSSFNSMAVMQAAYLHMLAFARWAQCLTHLLHMAQHANTIATCVYTAMLASFIVSMLLGLLEMDSVWC